MAELLLHNVDGDVSDEEIWEFLMRFARVDMLDGDSLLEEGARLLF